MLSTIQLIQSLSGTEQAILLWIAYLLVANIVWLITWTNIRKHWPPKIDVVDALIATAIAAVWPILAIILILGAIGAVVAAIILSPVLLYHGIRVLIQKRLTNKRLKEALYENELRALQMKNRALQEQNQSISSNLVKTQLELKDTRDHLKDAHTTLLSGITQSNQTKDHTIKQYYGGKIIPPTFPKDDQPQMHLRRVAEDMARSLDRQIPDLKNDRHIYNSEVEGPHKIRKEDTGYPLKPIVDKELDRIKDHLDTVDERAKEVRDFQSKNTKPEDESILYNIKKKAGIDPKTVKCGMFILDPLTNTMRKATKEELRAAVRRDASRRIIQGDEESKHGDS